MRRSVVFSQCALFVITALVSAQAPRGPGRFGGGPPRMPRFGPGALPSSNLAFLETGEVLEELGATEAQRTVVGELLEKVREAMRTSFESIDSQELRALSREERDKRFEEARAKGAEAGAKADEKLDGVLTTAQRERLTQLRLQREGLSALLRPDVVERLGLSEPQQERIRKIETGSRPRFGRFGQADALALLTDQQKAAWAGMVGKPFTFPEPRFGFGPGGPGGPMGEKRLVVKEFDKDGNGRLNKEERAAARQSPKTGRRGGPPRRGRANETPPAPGARLTPADVPSYIDAGLYDPSILRTLFLDFESEDWEAELADFHGTDVEVPATLTVDGRKYANVGVHFRGMSSYMMVSAGYKRSLNVSIDQSNRSQRLYRYKTLNLLNSHGDPSYLSTVLYSHIARKYLPAPKANFVKVVINGTSWGIYVNVQQFNKEFLAENHPSSAGSRWKVPGSPGAAGGLEYIGDGMEDYKRHFTIKSPDTEAAWKALIGLCRTLNKTPLDDLEAALKPILDIDGVLWFLALDVALVNSDGYWTRASDYSLFLDGQGMFHLYPHDINEAFQGARGHGGGPPGGFGPPGRGPGMGPRGGGVELDPLVGMDNSRIPLRSRLLAVPRLRKQYLQNVRTIAQAWFDWEKLGPLVARYRSLLDKDVEADTRKLDSYAAFQRAVGEDVEPEGATRGRGMSLKAFAARRRTYLLTHPEIQASGF